MGLAIWKFPIPFSDDGHVEMPAGARLLTVALQRRELCVWAAVDTEAPTVRRRFAIRGTGHPLRTVGPMTPFVGTFFLDGGALVFHVFDLGEAGE